MPDYIRHFNDSTTTDAMLGGKCLDYQISRSADSFDRGTVSVLHKGSTVIGGNSPPTSGQGDTGIIKLGDSMPGRSKMFCIGVDQRRAEGGSTIWTGQYMGFASGSDKAKASLLGPDAQGARVTLTSTTRQERFPAGGNVEVPGFPSTTNNLAVRFNNIIFGCTLSWVASKKADYPNLREGVGTLGFTPPAPTPPNGEDGPWAGIMPVVRVYPYGWVLRNMTQRQEAADIELYFCEAHWVYEWKYQPALNG